MGCRSYICIEMAKDTYKGVYCHCDGYLTHNGAMLLDHYNIRSRVERLISLGDLSLLQPKLYPTTSYHSFNDREADVCVFYGRDRGESRTEARMVDLEDYDDPSNWIEYCYVYTLEGKWKYFECGRYKEMGLYDLELALEEEYECLGFPRPEQVYGFYTDDDVAYYKRLKGENELCK